MLISTSFTRNKKLQTLKPKHNLLVTLYCTIRQVTATYPPVNQNIPQPAATILQSEDLNNPIGSFSPSSVSHIPYTGHIISPVSNNLPPPPVSHNPYATPYIPLLNDNLPPVTQISLGYKPYPSAITGFSKFLLGKEFLLTRFSNVDDRPETLSIWMEFRNIVEELGVTPFE